jgi:hypothetical protein
LQVLAAYGAKLDIVTFKARDDMRPTAFNAPTITINILFAGLAKGIAAFSQLLPPLAAGLREFKFVVLQTLGDFPLPRLHFFAEFFHVLAAGICGPPVFRQEAQGDDGDDSSIDYAKQRTVHTNLHGMFFSFSVKEPLSPCQRIARFPHPIIKASPAQIRFPSH